MKIQNLFIAFFTCLLLSYGNLIFADDMTDGDLMSVITVNINADNAETLAANLTGVGLGRAEAIVAYRKAHGRFYSAEELTAVRGIGQTTIEKNSEKIVVD